MIEITKRGTHVMVLISHATQSNDGHYYDQIKRIPTAKFHVYVFDTHCTCYTCASFILVSLVLIDACTHYVVGVPDVVDYPYRMYWYGTVAGT